MLVEAALMLPVFMMIFFGIIEFGLAFGDYLTISNGTQSGARMATTSGNDVLADYRIVQAIAADTDLIPDANIERIVVFKADAATDAVPPNCISAIGGVQHVCNVYSPLDFDRPATDYGCIDAEDLDEFWCPTDRKVNSTASTGGPPDYIGIWIEVTHPYVIGLFGSSITMTHTTVMRIEPRAL